MFKKFFCWLYLRSISKREDHDIFIWNTRYDESRNKFVFQYHRLFAKQIEAILKIIDQELVKSYQSGLKISREHVLKEKGVILAILDGMGNLDTIPKNFSFEEAAKIFSEAMGKLIQEELTFYSEKLDREGCPQNMYNLHLESVRNAILRALYEKRLPLT